MDSVRNSIMDYGLLKFSWDSYRYLSIIPSFITPGYSSGIPPAIPPGLSPGFPRICFRNSCTKSSKITSYLIDHSRDASWGFSYDSFADYFMEYPEITSQISPAFFWVFFHIPLGIQEYSPGFLLEFLPEIPLFTFLEFPLDILPVIPGPVQGLKCFLLTFLQ